MDDLAFGDPAVLSVVPAAGEVLAGEVPAWEVCQVAGEVLDSDLEWEWARSLMCPSPPREDQDLQAF